MSVQRRRFLLRLAVGTSALLTLLHHPDDRVRKPGLQPPLLRALSQHPYYRPGASLASCPVASPHRSLALLTPPTLPFQPRSRAPGIELTADALSCAELYPSVETKWAPMALPHLHKDMLLHAARVRQAAPPLQGLPLPTQTRRPGRDRHSRQASRPHQVA